jgi:hypothetical protein
LTCCSRRSAAVHLYLTVTNHPMPPLLFLAMLFLISKTVSVEFAKKNSILIKSDFVVVRGD